MCTLFYFTKGSFALSFTNNKASNLFPLLIFFLFRIIFIIVIFIFLIFIFCLFLFIFLSFLNICFFTLNCWVYISTLFLVYASFSIWFFFLYLRLVTLVKFLLGCIHRLYLLKLIIFLKCKFKIVKNSIEFEDVLFKNEKNLL